MAKEMAHVPVKPHGFGGASQRADNVTALKPDGSLPPLPEFTTTAASTLPEGETLVVNAQTREIGVEVDWEAKCRALERELRLTRGNLSNVLNNVEQEKSRLERERRALDERKRKLDERDAQAVDELSQAQVDYWKGQAEKARVRAEEYRERLSKVLDLTHEIDRAARW